MGDEWLEMYDGQSTGELLAMRDGYRIDSLVVAFEEAIWRKPAESLTRGERYVLAVEALEREVNNGGYSQFFLNSRSAFLDVIVEALQAIGCPQTAAITRDAIDALGLPPGATDERVEQTVLSEEPKMKAAFDRCDDRYYEGSEPIADRLFDWIDANRDAIRL
jgi:hypothetical protein